MITESTIYWITRLDGIKEGILIVGIIFAAVGAILLARSDVLRYEDRCIETSKRILIYGLWCVISILFATSHIFIPSTKEMCAIKMIPVVMNDEEVQKLPDTVLELTNEWIEELRPKSSKIDILDGGQ